MLTCHCSSVPRHLSPAWQMPASGSSSSLRSRGGLEDWDDLEGAHVDRYGFITMPPQPGSRMGTPFETRSASGSPRKRNILQKRDPYTLSSTLSGSGRRTPTRKVSARSLNTQHSELSVSTSLRSSRSVIRQASNLLPHNRDRRWMDEAGDMLNSTLSSIPEIRNLSREPGRESPIDGEQQRGGLLWLPVLGNMEGWLLRTRL
jgi:hypothetical protein